MNNDYMIEHRNGGGRPRWQVTGLRGWADPDRAGGWLLGAFIHCLIWFSYNGEQCHRFWRSLAPCALSGISKKPEGIPVTLNVMESLEITYCKSFGGRRGSKGETVQRKIELSGSKRVDRGYRVGKNTPAQNIGPLSRIGRTETSGSLSPLTPALLIAGPAEADAVPRQ
ncbi:hypothetical protein T10_10586 [Trichinella papuae]|uniref:Uncharacterized protein n=1 Tax=Trichinella papuae TaxID=268474 RepID=A0A0V1MPU6_9BILA|nr:hypothetical protein T10_10586 [Trichinella papuae]